MTIRVSLTTSFAFLPQSSQSFLWDHREQLQFSVPSVAIDRISPCPRLLGDATE